MGVKCVKLWGVEADGRALASRTATLFPLDDDAKDDGLRRALHATGRATFLCCAYLKSGLLVAGTSTGEVGRRTPSSSSGKDQDDSPVFRFQ